MVFKYFSAQLRMFRIHVCLETKARLEEFLYLNVFGSVLPKDSFSISFAHLSITTSLQTLTPLHSIPPPNLCGLADDRPDFTWAQPINALTLDFNQAICLRVGTAFAALADSFQAPTLV